MADLPIYSLSVSLVLLTVYSLGAFSLRKYAAKKLRRIRDSSIQDAVETDSPTNNQIEILKKQGVEGLEQRFSFLQKTLPLVFLAIWFLALALPYLGQLPTVYISVITAILSVAVGIALRPFLENLFSGIVISFFKAIRIGDTVRIDGEYGLIEKIGLTYSILKRWDWNRIIIPNSKLIQKEIHNLTLEDQYIWAHVEFFVEPNADMDVVRDLAISAAKESPYNSQSEEPSFWIMSIEKDAILCWIAAWANHPSDAWELRSEVRTKVISGLKREGIKLHSKYFQSVGPYE